MTDLISNSTLTPAIQTSPVSRGQSFEPAGAQYNFAEIFGAASDERGIIPAAANDTPRGLSPTIAAATATVSAASAAPSAASSVTLTSASAQATTTSTATPAATAADSTTSTGATGGSTPTTGVQALVSAIMNGSLQPTYVTDPSKLQEINPAGSDYMPNFYYASDQTANQIASLLGGKVVQMTPFGQDAGWTEPKANFIQLNNGMTVNAADLAYYARCGAEGPTQLTADLTQTINEGAAWTNYYQNGGAQPIFAMGYVGPPIPGTTYGSGSIGADGNVINPAMQPVATQGT